MKYIWMTLFLLLFFLKGVNATEIKGKVIDLETREPVVYAMLTVHGVGDVISGLDGTWSISINKEGPFAVYVEARGYTPKMAELGAGETFLLIELEKLKAVQTEKSDPTVTVITDEEDELDNQQSAAGILSASKDVFDRIAAYEFGALRFRSRGLDSKYYNLWFNGAPVNDVESGRATWGIFGGLNDAVRNQEATGGLINSNYDFNNVGGSGYINTSPFLYRPGIKTTYSMANRNYRHRAMVTWSSGMMDGNWAVTVSASRRWAEEGYVPGTFYDAYGSFLSVGKKIGTEHELTFTAFAAPSRGGRNSAITREAAGITGSNFYNPYWGIQGDKKRNTRVSSYFEPTGILNYKWAINDKTKLTTVLSYSNARNGYTALNWLQGKDPRPDYYRYFPSYYKNDKINYLKVLDNWYSNPEVGQVDWDFIYNVNRIPKKVFGVNGDENESFEGLVSSYIIENRVTEKNSASANIMLEHILTEEIKINSGFNYRWYEGRHYNEVEDLLGGEYFFDIDKFAQREFPDLQSAYNDLNNPGRLLQEGDRYSHDYSAHVNKWEAWVEGEYEIGMFSAFLSGRLSGTEMWREGFTRKGLFPNNSFGDSEHMTFLNYGVHTGFDFKPNGRHMLRFNGLIMTQAPVFRNALVSPRTRNQIVDNLSNEQILSGEAAYILRLSGLNARMSAYYSTFKNNTRTISFYHDSHQNLLNYILTGIDTRHAGLEFGLEYDLSDGLKTHAVLSVGEYIYTSRPRVNAFVDNKAEPIAEESGVVYAKGFYVPGTPMTAASWGINYRSPKFWWAGYTVNFLGDRYLDFNPARRTNAAVQGLNLNDANDYALYRNIIEQERISDAFYANAFVGKSWYLGDYYLIASLNISNILNNKEIVTGGYEQYRFDYVTQDPQKFPNKYYYAYGRNYYLNISISF